ncbi:unnamed protein product [Cuscuta campestris]|uniref:Uncharacterized protein n=1 Tax=Cuscuta campestris TaxID=132261 RepID=A0A484LR53_9ASTE|nr:unnamed protein product [Cuscuta campestris]
MPLTKMSGAFFNDFSVTVATLRHCYTEIFENAQRTPLPGSPRGHVGPTRNPTSATGYSVALRLILLPQLSAKIRRRGPPPVSIMQRVGPAGDQPLRRPEVVFGRRRRGGEPKLVRTERCRRRGTLPVAAGGFLSELTAAVGEHRFGVST